MGVSRRERRWDRHRGWRGLNRRNEEVQDNRGGGGGGHTVPSLNISGHLVFVLQSQRPPGWNSLITHTECIGGKGGRGREGEGGAEMGGDRRRWAEMDGGTRWTEEDKKKTETRVLMWQIKTNCDVGCLCLSSVVSSEFSLLFWKDFFTIKAYSHFWNT